MSDLQHLTSIKHPLAFGSLRNWLRLLWENGGVAPRYWPRAGFITTVSLLTAPLRLYERLRYDPIVRAVKITEPPIFILGHWRSGTTLLHNLMSQDPALGYPTTFQTIAPEICLAGESFMEPLLRAMMPTTRAMDNMRLLLDGPQEEEFALVNSSPYAMYHHLSFPLRANHYFTAYSLFRNVNPAVLNAWQTDYLHILRKATLKAQGKRLVIKNPANTGRIRLLLDLFPHAKFIHICRDPYEIFVSTQRFYAKTLAMTQLQTITPAAIESMILRFYQELLQQYLADRWLIPAQNLIEVRFEVLEAAPLAELERIYTHLQLPGFANANPHFQQYLADQADYRKNCYAISADVIAKVNQHWQFAFVAWGYALRQMQQLEDGMKG